MLDQDFIESCKTNFITYINGLEIHPNFKREIVDMDFIEQNPHFYLYYPNLFSISKVIDDSLLSKIAIAGFLFYRSTLIMDALIDNKDSSGMAIAMICQEEAIKLLTSIFGLNSEYWHLWNKRRNEYFQSAQFDKNYKKSKKIVSLKEYEQLSDLKSAFGKAAIDSLYVLNKDHYHRIYGNLLISHKYFSIAFQINDDILDFKDDYLTGQFNWAVQNAEIDIDGQSRDIDGLKKLFYIQGNAKFLFQNGVQYLDMALKEVENINVPLWKNEIGILKNKLQNSIREIDNYLEILNSEVSLSHQPKSMIALDGSIEDAIKYISDRQGTKGEWKEYINQGGISDVWSTGFICNMLSENEFLKKRFSKNIEKAINFLTTSKIDNGLWGYNRTWIEDSDSTNLVLLSFLNNSVEIEKGTLDNWLGFKRNNAGFSTYRDSKYLLESLADKGIDNVNGWCGSHQCVSAVSFYFLVLYAKDSTTTKDLGLYFDELMKDGNISSYWWTSEIYTYYFLAKSYFALNEQGNLGVIQERIKKGLHEKSYFEDAYGENLFLSGMVLEILLLNNDKYGFEIEKLKDYLLNKQFQDGSWENSHTLQIPDPSHDDPKDKIYGISSHGTSVRAKEFNRLFTTVSILKGLSEYVKRASCP